MGSLPVAMSTETAPTSYGRYQVLETLGSGAMGVVYLGVDPRLARPVAIKVLRESEFLTPAEREQYRARFRNEAEAAGRLSHPSIVQIYDIGPTYLVMEYLEGRPLSSLLKSGAATSVREVTSLILRVADAIDHAHRHGIIHRDVKPANIMLLDDGGVKVMDFGVARLDSSSLTAAGTVVGSVRYMAPEQMMGEKVDGRADVFSLASVAYELLTGRAPFPGKTITEVISRVVHGAHVPPRDVDGRLPEAVNGVFARAFAPKLEERYSGAVDFARDLRLAAEGVLALPLSHWGEEEVPTHVPPSTPTVKAMPAARETLLMDAAVALREAVLLLDSDPPGARVFLDNHPVGESPITGLEVSFGRHLVRMELPGYETVSLAVELTWERPLKALTLVLPLAPSPQRETRAGQFVPLGPGVTPPRRVSGPLPTYPEAAQERGLGGSPVVDVWLSEAGEVLDAAVVESAGPLLDDALLEAVRRWRFAPATLQGVPVSVRLTVQHLFKGPEGR